MPVSPSDSLPKLEDLIASGVKGKRVLVRVDMNVPVEHGKVSDATRITRVVPTLKALMEAGAKVIILSHFGRPEGAFDRELSLAPIADTVGTELGGASVKFAVDCIGSDAEEAVDALQDGEILLLENLRFHAGEKANDPEFVAALAALGDAYVNDAFSCSHRPHASIVGVAEKLPAYAGLSLEKEVETLSKILNDPERPLAAIVGGAKISTKIDLLESLVAKVDVLAIGGAMANTFLYAQGHKVGKSLCEKELKETALTILQHAEEHQCEVLLPEDVIVAKELVEKTNCAVEPIDRVQEDEMILDIGPVTVWRLSHAMEKCKTVLWNGPLGAFEVTPFDVGTISLSRVIAGLTESNGLTSVAGGGDIMSALYRAGLRNGFSYLSTAGGAFLEWLEGKDLPGVAVLKQ